MYKHLLLLFFTATILFSCSNTDPVNDRNDDQEVPEINSFIDEIMHEPYLWADEVPVISDIGRYTAEELVNTLKVEQDEFTFIEKSSGGANSRTNNDFEIEVGSGIYLGTADKVNFYVLHVTEDSPADRMGIKRGDQILSVNNGSSFDDIIELNAGQEGLTMDVSIKRNNSINDYSFQLEKIASNYVGPTEIFKNEDESVITGYVNYESFKTVSEEALVDVFNEFLAEGVNNLILDLRFNGGGLVSTSAKLASLIYPPAQESDIFLQQTFNEKYQSQYNRNVNFDPQNVSNRFDKVAIIQDQNTASASESIIWCLRPYLQDRLRTFGFTSRGKDVGSFVLTEHGYNFYPIVFRITDKNGLGDYGDGIQPDEEVRESISNIINNPLTSRNERRVAAALAWIEDLPAIARTRSTEGAIIISPSPQRQLLIDNRD